MKTKGEIEAARSLCTDLARQHHAKAFPLVATAIEACADPRILREWALAAPLTSDDEFVRLVTAPRPVRSRVPRPSRRSPAPRRR